MPLNILVVSQATGYVVSVCMSLCISIPISLHLKNFDNHCLLYTTGSFSPADGTFTPVWAMNSFCSFTDFVGILTLAVSVIQGIRMCFFLYSGSDSSFFSALLDTIVCLLLTGFIFVAAIMISGGFKIWCDAVTQRFPSCEDASIIDHLIPEGTIKTKGFYLLFGTAQFGAWVAWVCWVLLTVLATRKLCRYHEQENMRVSMLRERQRLLKGDTESLLEIDN